MSKHTLVGGDGRELPDFLPAVEESSNVLRRRSSLLRSTKSDSMVSGPFAKDGSALVQLADQMEEQLSAGLS